MPLNMRPSFAHSNAIQCGGCGRCLACDRWASFSSRHQMRAGHPGRVVGCSHFSRRHYGDRSVPCRRHIRQRSSEAGQAAGAHGLGVLNYPILDNIRPPFRRFRRFRTKHAGFARIAGALPPVARRASSRYCSLRVVRFFWFFFGSY